MEKAAFSCTYIGSYKGTMLEVGERSGLVIGPGGSACTVTSSDPDTVEVEQVMNFWTAVAKAEGSAEITVSNQTGETATLTLTVGSHAPQAPTVESIDSVIDDTTRDYSTHFGLKKP